MGKREFTEQDLQDFDISEDKKAEIAKLLNDGKKIKVSNNFNLDTKMSLNAQFVVAFTSNLRQLAELNISQNELKIITYILEVMEYGNLISISQAAIARNTGIAKSNVSHNFKKLKDKNILILDKDGNLLMNSALFQKGLSHSMNKERIEHLKNAQCLELIDKTETFEIEQERGKDKTKTKIKVKKDSDTVKKSLPLERTL